MHVRSVAHIFFRVLEKCQRTLFDQFGRFFCDSYNSQWSRKSDDLTRIRNSLKMLVRIYGLNGQKVQKSLKSSTHVIFTMNSSIAFFTLRQWRLLMKDFFSWDRKCCNRFSTHLWRNLNDIKTRLKGMINWRRMKQNRFSILVASNRSYVWSLYK